MRTEAQDEISPQADAFPGFPAELSILVYTLSNVRITYP